MTVLRAYWDRVPPSWVRRSDNYTAVFDLEFVNDQSCINETEDDIAAVLATARLDEDGVEVLWATPDDLVIDIADISNLSESAFTVVTEATCAASHGGNCALWGIQKDDSNRHTQYRTNVPRIKGFAAVGGAATLTNTDNATSVADNAAPESSLF